jgi:hypothetical protein
VHKRLSALLLQAGNRQALLPDGALLPTAMCLSETGLLQPLLRGSQVLCSGSGRLLCPGSLCRGSALLPGSGRRSGLLCSVSVRCGSPLLPGSGRCSGLLRSGCVCRCSSLLPRSGDLRLPGSVCRSSVL